MATMARLDESVYTARVAGIAVKPITRRKYTQSMRMANVRVRIKGHPQPLDVNVAERRFICWSLFHPDVRDNLPRALTRAFRNIPLPKRYQLQWYKSLAIEMLDTSDSSDMTIRACTRQMIGDQFDHVSLEHGDDDEVLDCYYTQVLLIFKFQGTQVDNDVWLLVKNMTPVKRDAPVHPKMKRLHLKYEMPDRLYSIFSASSILDKEHVIPDFKANGNCFFVGKNMFF